MLALLWYLADPLSDLRAAAFLRSRFVRLSDEALRRLAPRLADALRVAEPPPAAAPLDAADARGAGAARAATPRWRGLVDRLPPAELLDRDPQRVRLRGRDARAARSRRRART